MSIVQFTLRVLGYVFNNSIGSVNLFRFVHYENYLPAVVPTARRQVSAAAWRRSVRRHQIKGLTYGMVILGTTHSSKSSHFRGIRFPRSFPRVVCAVQTRNQKECYKTISHHHQRSSLNPQLRRCGIRSEQIWDSAMAWCDGDVGGKRGMAFQRCCKDPKLFPWCSYRIASVLTIGILWLCLFLKFKTSFCFHCVDCTCDRRIVSDVVKYLSPCSYADYKIIKVLNAA